MSRGSKCAKPDAMGISEEPLNEREITVATGLLSRAIKHGQQRLILDGFIHQPGGLKSLAVTADAVMKEMDFRGKRDREEAEQEAARFSAGCEDSEWDAISHAEASPKGYLGTTRGSYVGEHHVPPPMPSSEKHPYENMKIPMPDGINSIADWGRTVCQLDKVKSKRMTYAQMISQADFDPEMASYLTFIKGKFGSDDSGNLPKKITPAVDLAAYLERVKYQGLSEAIHRRIQGAPPVLLVATGSGRRLRGL
eukprot:s2854_g3.t1